MAVLAFALASATACNDGSSSAQPGVETGSCLDGQCLPGLVCLSDLCVNPGATSADGTTSGGGDTTMGATGDTSTTSTDPTDPTDPTTSTTDPTDPTDTTSVGETGCEGDCQIDADCQPGQTCISCICVGEPVCEFEGEGEFGDCFTQGDAACMSVDGQCLFNAQPAAAGTCFFPCTEPCDCPEPPQGFEVGCSDIVANNTDTFCHLDCSNDGSCPTGMVCLGDTLCMFANIIPTYEDCVNETGFCDEEGYCVVDVIADPAKGICSPPCMNNAECDSPASGDATPVCAPLNNQISACLLDCSSGQTCPTGMLCDPIHSICTWGLDGLPTYGECLDETEVCELGGGCIVSPSMDPTHSSCATPCAAQGECFPAPEGDAVPTCFDLGAIGPHCLLDCTTGETCPTGMDCIGDGQGTSVCLWPN